ncbi:MAG: hypothetical protein QM831_26100 [Kofleriaceae bacterium]
MRTLVLVCLAATATACAHHDDGHGDDSLATLSINPPTSDLTVLNTTPATEDFTATLTFPDGSTEDVTSTSQFSVTVGYGDFLAQTLTARGAGKMTVLGVYKDKQASAEVVVHAQGTRVDPSLPANTPDLFTGAETIATAPAIVYPAENVVMPRNLGDFEIHWTDASPNDIWEISLHTDLSDMRVYVPGKNGLASIGPSASYQAFLSTEWAAAVGSEATVTYQVRGVQSANPGAGVGAAPPRLVKLTNEEMNGGIYYWASAGDDANSPEGIWRHDMAKPGEPAEQFETLVQTTSADYPNGRCIACHTLSRDGAHMVVTWDGGDGASSTVDVGTKTVSASGADAWNFSTFTPDGNTLLTVHDGVLVVRDYASLAVLASPTFGGMVSHPDLSPDGTQLVYVRRPTTDPVQSDWSFTAGQIWTRSFDASTNTFGPETMLVSDSSNNYYPSYSPDGKWVLFNKASADSYNDVDATVYVVKADGTAAPIQLAQLNTGASLTNSWARWAPFQQTVGTESIYWITVSSQRNFGVRIDQAARVAAMQGKRPQIWMAAFVPSVADVNMDPTQPSFRLPFQNITTNNHIAQWTERVVVTQ